MREAHIVGVIHDAANKYTRGRLDYNILNILNAMGNKPAFLVLNKVGSLIFTNLMEASAPAVDFFVSTFG